MRPARTDYTCSICSCSRSDILIQNLLWIFSNSKASSCHHFHAPTLFYVLLTPSRQYCNDHVSSIMQSFYMPFIVILLQHAEEARYKFATPSTLKPTQICCSEGSINQLPPWTEIQGDIRLTPFYDIFKCIEKVHGYVKELNDG